MCKGSVSASSTSSYLVLKKKDERRKKEEKEEKNWPNRAFRAIMDRLDGMGLECSGGTSSIAQ